MKRIWYSVFEPSQLVTPDTPAFYIKVGDSVQEQRKFVRASQMIAQSPHSFYFEKKSDSSTDFMLKLNKFYGIDSRIVSLSQFLAFLKANLPSFQTPSIVKNPCQNSRNQQEFLQPTSQLQSQEQ